MTTPLLADDGGQPSPDGVRVAAWRASFRRLASLAQPFLPRIYDALVLAWLSVFHHVLGVKYRFAQIAYDEHWFLSQGWSVLKGQVPYRDFQEFKPPVIFLVNALGLQLFGLEGLGYRKFLALLSLAGFLALAVALLSRRTQRWLVIAALMLMINHFYDDGLHNSVINDAESLALDFFMLGAGTLLTRTSWKRTQQVLGGALLSLSPLSKEPMAFAVLAAWLTLLALEWLESGGKAAAKRFALFTIAGVAGVAATWLVYMLATRSLSWYVLQLRLNFAYAANYAYQVRWAQRAPEGGRFVTALRKLHEGYVNVEHLGVLATFGVALLLSVRKRCWLVSVGALATFAAALYAVSVGSGFTARYFIMAMTGTFLWVVLGALAFDAWSKQAGHERWRWLGLGWLGVALVMTLPRFDEERRKYSSYKAPPPPVAQSLIDLVREHTRPGDTIFSTDDPLVSVYTDRLSAFRGGIVLDEIIEYYPGKTDVERLQVVRDGLEEKRPKLVCFGNTMVGPHRRRRYFRALVWPFLYENKYVRLNDNVYLRPD